MTPRLRSWRRTTTLDAYAGRPPARTGTPARAGVTLAELLIVVGILSLFAGLAVALLSGGHAEAAGREAARQMAADVMYAQADAIAQRSGRSIAFDFDGGRYTLATSSGETLVHPVSKRPFVVDLAALYSGSSLRLLQADFSGSATLELGPDGTVLTGGTVTLASARARFRIRIAQGSGRVSIEGPLDPDAMEAEELISD